MAQALGYVTKTQTGGYEGALATISLNASIRIEPNPDAAHTSDAPRDEREGDERSDDEQAVRDALEQAEKEAENKAEDAAEDGAAAIEDSSAEIEDTDAPGSP